MCNQTISVIARVCEEAGMSTCCFVNVREVAERARPPRAVYAKWPFGSPMGEPDNMAQQRRILLDMLEAVRGTREPGAVHELNYRWRREDYATLTGLKLPN